MSTDWVDDEQLSRDETLARFAALQPTVLTGPPNSLWRISLQQGAVSQHASEPCPIGTTATPVQARGLVAH